MVGRPVEIHQGVHIFVASDSANISGTQTMYQYPAQSFGPSVSDGERWTKQGMPCGKSDTSEDSLCVGNNTKSEKSARTKYHGTSGTKLVSLVGYVFYVHFLLAEISQAHLSHVVHLCDIAE